MYGHQQRVVNPWERDPKETERKRRERDQRQVRDDEIRRLESGRVQDLSAAEADHLRRLKLQAEFDRRATEAELRHEFQENHTDMTSAVSHNIHVCSKLSSYNAAHFKMF